MSELPLEFRFNLPDGDDARKLIESYFNKGRVNMSFTPIKYHVENDGDRKVTVYDEIKINHLSLQPLENKK